jgi:hypothetical protein
LGLAIRECLCAKILQNRDMMDEQAQAYFDLSGTDYRPDKHVLYGFWDVNIPLGNTRNVHVLALTSITFENADSEEVSQLVDPDNLPPSTPDSNVTLEYDLPLREDLVDTGEA